MFHPDLHEQDPEKRKTYELLTQAINEARDRGDIGLLEIIAKDDTQAFILKQGWASAEMEIFLEAEQDEEVIDRIAAVQQKVIEQEIAG